MEEGNQFKIVEYESDGCEDSVYLENIFNEFKIEYDKLYCLKSDDNFHIKNRPPKSSEDMYFIRYSCVMDKTNSHHQFAEYLIDTMNCVLGYLEDCIDTIEDKE